MYLILYGMWHGWVLPYISQKACKETAYPWAGVKLIRTFLHFCFFKYLFSTFIGWTNCWAWDVIIDMQVLKAQSLSMDKSLCESGNSVSVVVYHGRRKFFVRIDMNKYAKTQITQYNSPWGYWKLIALYMENINR